MFKPLFLGGTLFLGRASFFFSIFSFTQIWLPPGGPLNLSIISLFAVLLSCLCYFCLLGFFIFRLYRGITVPVAFGEGPCSFFGFYTGTKKESSFGQFVIRNFKDYIITPLPGDFSSIKGFSIYGDPK